MEIVEVKPKDLLMPYDSVRRGWQGAHPEAEDENALFAMRIQVSKRTQPSRSAPIRS